MDKTRVLYMCLGLSVGRTATADQTADLVLMRGKIATLGAAPPEAQALAAKNGRILAVGSDSVVNAYIGTRIQVIDLHSKLAVPGFPRLPPVGRRMAACSSRILVYA